MVEWIAMSTATMTAVDTIFGIEVSLGHHLAGLSRVWEYRWIVGNGGYRHTFQRSHYLYGEVEEGAGEE